MVHSFCPCYGVQSFALPYHIPGAHALPTLPVSNSQLRRHSIVSAAELSLPATLLSDFESDFRPSIQDGRKLARPSNSQEWDMHTQLDFAFPDDCDTDSENPLETAVKDGLYFDECGSHIHDLPSQSLRKPFNKLDFAREYDIAALRVPAAECQSIANRIRGHLLNWPRIKNVARVEGDDLEDDVKNLLGDSKEASGTDSFLNAVYGAEQRSSSLSERIQAVEKMDFPHLERLSWPYTKARNKNKRNETGKPAKYIKAKLYHVEVAEERLSCNSDEPSLLNVGFRTRRWIGPTRLLLLDTKYAEKFASELPMAVQVLLNETIAHSKGQPKREIVPCKPKREIVPCKLTLFYEYWSLEEVLKELLPGVLIATVFETVGHLAYLNLDPEHLPLKDCIAKVVFDKHRPKIQTVVNKLATQSQSHTMQLEVLAGNHSLVTTIVENGIRFHVNLSTLYWDSKLATERHRLIQSFNEKDVLCDVFAGVGPLAVAAAKKVWRVFANDSNSEALKYLAKTVSENKLQAKIEVYNLDGRKFIRKLLAFNKPVFMTQVVMNLPTNAEMFLDAFRGAFNRSTWSGRRPMPTIHVYGISNSSDPESNFLERIICRLGHAPENVEMHRVYLEASGKWMLCATFQLPQTVAFND